MKAGLEKSFQVTKILLVASGTLTGLQSLPAG
jgi:hypothetical protein